MKENRTKPRFDVCLTARFQGSASNQNVRISDLSEGGCYIDTIAEVTEGEAMVLQIMLPDGAWFKLQGVVAHRFPRLGFGVRFVNLDEKQLRQIRSLISPTSPDQSETDEASQTREVSAPDQIDLTHRHIM